MIIGWKNDSDTTYNGKCELTLAGYHLLENDGETSFELVVESGEKVIKNIRET